MLLDYPNKLLQLHLPVAQRELSLHDSDDVFVEVQRDVRKETLVAFDHRLVAGARGVERDQLLSSMELGEVDALSAHLFRKRGLIEFDLILWWVITTKASGCSWCGPDGLGVLDRPSVSSRSPECR